MKAHFKTTLAASSLVLLSLAFDCIAQQQTTARILLYTATADFRHDSIPTAIQSLKNQSNAFNVQFDATEDKSRFTDDGLGGYDAIMWVSTTGEGACLESRIWECASFVFGAC
jgi:hypothetical protein